MKNDSPIGTSRRAQSSSGSEKSSSQTTRVPVGRRLGSPERWAQQVAHDQRIRRSFEVEQVLVLGGMPTPQRSQRSSASPAVPAGGSCAGPGAGPRRSPRNPVTMLARRRAATASSMARPFPLIVPAPPAPPRCPRRAGERVRDGASRRRANGRPAAGSSGDRSSGRSASPRRARRPRSIRGSSDRRRGMQAASPRPGDDDGRASHLDPGRAGPRRARRPLHSAHAIRTSRAVPASCPRAADSGGPAPPSAAGSR